MYRVKNVPKPPLGIPIGHEMYNTQPRIRSLSNINNYECFQTNGQRKWIRKDIDLKKMNIRPSLDCEIFIGKIPYNVFEDELIPLLCQAGTLHVLRLLVQFNGNNRGYAFAQYTTIEEAKRAIDMLNNYPIRPHRKLGVMFAIQNTTLYLRNIPTHISTEEIVKLIRQNARGVNKVNFNNTFTQKSVTITYETHRDATLARKKIISDAIQEWKTHLYIDISGPPSLTGYPFNASPSTSPTSSESSSSANNFDDQSSCSLYSFLTGYQFNDITSTSPTGSESSSSANNFNDQPSCSFH